MEKLTKKLLDIVNAGIHGKKVEILPGEELDWEYLLNELSVGKLEAVCYNAVKHLTEQEGMHTEFLQKWQQRASYLGIKQLNAYIQLKDLLKEVKEEGIQLILFKGAALAQLYPEYLLRYSCDVDLLVKEEDRERTEQILKRKGYTKNMEHSKECVPVYVLPGSLIIELHTRLWEDYTGKRVQLLEKMDLTNPKKLLPMHACELDFLTLGYTEHLIYQMYHIIKHFSFQGMDLRHFTDTALYVNHYLAQIDFTDFWKKMRELDYEVFCYNLFCICIKYFEMSKEAISEAKVEHKLDEDALIEKLFSAGMLGLKNYETMVASSIVYQTYYANDSKAPSKTKILKASLFPAANDLSNKYSYAKKRHFLLPVAWCHRAWNHLIGMITQNGEAGMSEHIHMADKKFKILKELELMNKEE